MYKPTPPRPDPGPMSIPFIVSSLITQASAAREPASASWPRKAIGRGLGSLAASIYAAQENSDAEIPVLLVRTLDLALLDVEHEGDAWAHEVARARLEIAAIQVPGDRSPSLARPDPLAGRGRVKVVQKLTPCLEAAYARCTLLLSRGSDTRGITDPAPLRVLLTHESDALIWVARRTRALSQSRGSDSGMRRRPHRESAGPFLGKWAA
jgi:hypothetical protein